MMITSFFSAPRTGIEPANVSRRGGQFSVMSRTIPDPDCIHRVVGTVYLAGSVIWMGTTSRVPRIESPLDWLFKDVSHHSHPPPNNYCFFIMRRYAALPTSCVLG